MESLIGGTPWCSDFADAMLLALENAKYKNFSLSCWNVRRGQWNGNNLQHNFVIIKPEGHLIQFSPLVDPVITIVDPWRDLRPGVYPATGRPFGGPTNINSEPIGHKPCEICTNPR